MDRLEAAINPARTLEPTGRELCITHRVLDVLGPIQASIAEDARTCPTRGQLYRSWGSGLRRLMASPVACTGRTTDTAYREPLSRPRQPRPVVTKNGQLEPRGALSQQQQPYRKGKTNGPRRKTGRGGGDGGNAASLGGEISSGAAACGSSGCWPGLSTLHDLTPSCSVQTGQM